MSIDVETLVTIARPRSEVAAFMFDPRNDMVWTKAVLEVKQLDDGPLVAGSKVERTVSFLGRRFAYVYEVLDIDRERFVELTVERPFPMRVRYQVDDDDRGGTIATIRTWGDATGFFRVAAPIMAPMVRRNIARDLALLKRYLEQRPR